MVANDSRVVPARLGARKPTGGAVDLLVLPGAEPTRAEALYRSSKPLRENQVLTVCGRPVLRVLKAPARGRCLLETIGTTVVELLEQAGTVPLPPYIVRPAGAGPEDAARYQTIYARAAGSVAAPTAGLHFTSGVLERLRARGIGFATVTLHVGPGTFQPIRSDPEEHQMEAEWCEVSPEVAERIARTRSSGGRVVAVGTTTVRTLESAADEAGRVRPFAGATRLFIKPGYRFRAVDVLLTNFHLPRSTLLCLVLAFAGCRLTRAAYEAAIAERYRFYSYGDAMLVV
ncbi:MAG: tRNA preQ1(34) S-adenosylmethionine ribosyltransferase-isomerase QueA [Candidatus Dadabacteria bacterium]|nr:MAG: tRNA preQ1(34) S-adenosylmethionine ribosyltransferase-isomerase QueA [Candidatus Dadabacteria bacterium]